MNADLWLMLAIILFCLEHPIGGAICTLIFILSVASGVRKK